MPSVRPPGRAHKKHLITPHLPFLAFVADPWSDFRQTFQRCGDHSEKLGYSSLKIPALTIRRLSRPSLLNAKRPTSESRNKRTSLRTPSKSCLPDTVPKPPS